jgi:hypothetical protein
MYLGNKRGDILFELHGHSCLMALEDINVLTTHAHQLFKNNSPTLGHQIQACVQTSKKYVV